MTDEIEFSTPEETATVAELMARDPLKLSDQDLTKIIKHLRSKQRQFVLGNKAAGKPAKKQTKADKAGEAAMEVVGGKLDLSDLGL